MPSKLKELFDKANSNLNSFSHVSEVFQDTVNEAVELSLRGHNCYTKLVDPDYNLTDSHKDKIVKLFLEEGFNAYFMGSILALKWENADKGKAVELLSNFNKALEEDIDYEIGDIILRQSNLGHKGAYLYLDDDCFSSLIHKYSKSTVIKALKKYFKVTEGTFQEIYVEWT